LKPIKIRKEGGVEQCECHGTKTRRVGEERQEVREEDDDEVGYSILQGVVVLSFCDKKDSITIARKCCT